MNLVTLPGPVGSPAVAGPLPEHLQQIAEARVMGRKIRRASTVATLSGWSLAVFGGITLLSGLFDPATLLLGAGLLVCSFFELRGAGGLRRLDARAPKHLMRNQLLLAAIVASYAGFMIVRARLGPAPLSEASADPQVAEILGSFDNMARDLTAGFYALVMLIGIVVPGLTALYYASRRKYLERFSSSAAPWIVSLARKGIGV